MGYTCNRRKLKEMAKGVILAFGLFSSTGQGADLPPSQEILSPEELFHRCYRILVRKPALNTHPILARVKSGELTGVQSCLEILNLATLNSNGRLAVESEEGRRVLSTVYDFHRSWFPTDDYVNSLPDGEFFYWQGYIHDPSTPALYLTKALLTKDVPYSSIVLDNTYYQPYRDKFPVQPTYPIGGVQVFIYRLDFSVLPTEWRSPLFQEFGAFAGVRQITGLPEADLTLPHSLFINKPYKIFDYFGGGFIGTQSYMLLNMGRYFNEDMDGGFRLPRRMSQAIIRDVLCRDLPVIRATDAKKLVEPASLLPFRTQSSCMQCHATIDPMAEVSRNFRQIEVGYPGDFSKELAPAAIFQTPPGSGILYHEQQPNGKFRFRSYDGSLIEKDILGLKGLGEALAETSDLYVCAARRYVEFFTGLRVNLDDIGDPDRHALSPSDKRYREKVIDLGIGLAGHQDLRTFLKSLWESELFQKASMRDYVKVD